MTDPAEQPAAPRPHLSPAEVRKRKREAVIISISLLLILVLTWAELKLTRLSSEVPLAHNLLIFGFINIIVLLIILLVYLMARNAAKLLMERRRNAPGARLRTKLVIAFVALSLVPTMLLFFVSAGFIHNSIQNWFNQQVETALNESLEVAQTYYRTSSDNALYYARQISTSIKEGKLLNDQNQGALRGLIVTKQAEYNLGVVEVFSSQREELVRAANPKLPKGEITTPSSDDLRTALDGKEVTSVNPTGKADLIRGIVPIRSNWNEQDVVGAVVVNYYVPHSLVNKMREISASYEEYRRLKILKTPLITGYILALFLITTLIVFLAVWFGINLANSLTTPIQELAEATRQVAGGNLDVHLGAEGPDEIGLLVASFNRMTEDLRTNQQALQAANLELEHSNQELEQRRRYMETVLRSINAGVIAADKSGILITVNRAAERLLSIRTDEVIGHNFRDVLRPHQLDMVKEMLRDMVIGKHDAVSKQVTVPLKESKLTLQVNLTVLKDDNDEFIGTVVVFDDLTQLIKAQRMAAWREVARRIAHEIKNPLTPIQLSAQRLRKRYLERFAEDGQVFDDCTLTIIRSVDELKTLVDEFSNFARMPAAQPSPNDLNEIIREAFTLFQEAHRQIDFSFSADERLPLLQLDRDQLKRVMINLLDNAVGAVGADGRIEVATSFNPELKMASITVADNGHGIAPEDKPRLFEPYFSTKKTGTGLGLAIVNTIITDHQGFIRVKDNQPQGTRFIIELPAG